MGDRFLRFDQKILDWHESVSRRIQRLTGLSCFRQSRAVIIIAFGLEMFYIAHGKDVWQPATSLVVFLDAVMFSIIYRLSLSAEEQFHGFSGGRFGNSFRSVFARSRSIMVPITVFAGAIVVPRQNGFAGCFAMLFLASAMHLFSCSPAPPGRDRKAECRDALRYDIPS